MGQHKCIIRFTKCKRKRHKTLPCQWLMRQCMEIKRKELKKQRGKPQCAGSPSHGERVLWGRTPAVKITQRFAEQSSSIFWFYLFTSVTCLSRLFVWRVYTLTTSAFELKDFFFFILLHEFPSVSKELLTSSVSMKFFYFFLKLSYISWHFEIIVVLKNQEKQEEPTNFGISQQNHESERFFLFLW